MYPKKNIQMVLVFSSKRTNFTLCFGTCQNVYFLFANEFSSDTPNSTDCTMHAYLFKFHFRFMDTVRKTLEPRRSCRTNQGNF